MGFWRDFLYGLTHQQPPTQRQVAYRKLPHNVLDQFYPDDHEKVEAILRAFSADVSLDPEHTYAAGTPREHAAPPYWGYYVPDIGAGEIGRPPEMSERQARAAVALSCYLYALGVDVALCDRLARAYVLRFPA